MKSKKLIFCVVFLIIICSYAVKSQHSTVKLQLAGAVACWTKAYSSRDGVFKTLPASPGWKRYTDVCNPFWWEKISVQLSLARNCSCSDFSTAYKGSCNPAVSRPHIWHVRDKYTVNVDQDAILGNCDGWSWVSEHERRRSSEVTQAFFYKIPDYLVSTIEEIIIELDMKFSGSAQDEAYLYVFNDACDVSKHERVSYQYDCPKRIIRGEGEHSLRWRIVRDVEKYFERPDPPNQHWLSRFGKVRRYSTDWYYLQEPPWWKYNDKIDPRDNGYALLKFWITVPSGKDKRVFLFVKNVNVVVKIKSGINVSVSKGRRCKCNGRELECYDAGSTHQVFGSIWHGNSRIPYHVFRMFLVEKQTGTKKELYEDSGFLTTNIGQPLYTDSHGTFIYNFVMPNVSQATVYSFEASTSIVGNTSDTFEFCVLPKPQITPSAPTPVNNPIKLVKNFNDLTLKVGESINLGNLNDYFQDPDPGDSIQLCTAYSLTGKVDTKIQNLELTVIGKEIGQDYVRVVCFSTDNTFAKDDFNVEVVKPILKNPIRLVKNFSDLTLKVRESVNIGNMNDYFQDPDGDPIRFCTARTSTGAVDVKIQNLELTVIGKAVGQDYIEVECRSIDGSATGSFNVEVVEPSNNPIVLIKNFNDLTLKVGESINLGNLNDYFQDPDPGDSIQLCTARTSTGAVDVEIQNMELIVTGRVVGQDQVEVKCSSTDRTFAIDSFNVEVVDPSTGIGVSGEAGKKHRLYVVKRGARRGGLCLRNWKCSPWSECEFRCICKTKGLVDIEEYEVESCEMCKEECECGYFKIRTCEDMSGCDEDYFYQLKLGGEITPTPKPPESMVCVPREEKPVVMPEIEVTTPKPKKRNIWIFILLAAIVAWAIFFVVDRARNQVWSRKFERWMKFELRRGVAIGDIIKKLETSWMGYSDKQKEIASKIIENLKKKLLKRK